MEDIISALPDGPRSRPSLNGNREQQEHDAVGFDRTSTGHAHIIGSLPHLDIDDAISAEQQRRYSTAASVLLFDIADEAHGAHTVSFDVMLDRSALSTLLPGTRTTEKLGEVRACVLDTKKLKAAGYQFLDGADGAISKILELLFTRRGVFRFGPTKRDRHRFLIINSIILDPDLDDSGLHLLLAMHLASNPNGEPFDAVILPVHPTGRLSTGTFKFGFQCRPIPTVSAAKQEVGYAQSARYANIRATVAMSNAMPYQASYWARMGMQEWISSKAVVPAKDDPRVFGMCLDFVEEKYGVREVVPHFFSPGVKVEVDGQSVLSKHTGGDLGVGSVAGPASASAFAFQPAGGGLMTPHTTRQALKIRPEPKYHRAGGFDSPTPAYDLHDHVRATLGSLTPLRTVLNGSDVCTPRAVKGDQETLAEALGLFVNQPGPPEPIKPADLMTTPPCPPRVPHHKSLHATIAAPPALATPPWRASRTLPAGTNITDLAADRMAELLAWSDSAVTVTPRPAASATDRRTGSAGFSPRVLSGDDVMSRLEAMSARWNATRSSLGAVSGCGREEGRAERSGRDKSASPLAARTLAAESRHGNVAASGLAAAALPADNHLNRASGLMSTASRRSAQTRGLRHS